MRIRDLVENIAIELDNDDKLDFDLIDDLLFYMNHDDETYRRHTYPSIVKYKNSIDKGEETDHLLFGTAVKESYKKYCEEFPVKELPDSLSKAMMHKICHKLHDECGEHIKDGKL